MAICMVILFFIKNYLLLNLGGGMVKVEYLLAIEPLSLFYLLKEMKQNNNTASPQTVQLSPNIVHSNIPTTLFLLSLSCSFENITHMTHVFSSSYNGRGVPVPSRTSLSHSSGSHPLLLSQTPFPHQFSLLPEVISNAQTHKATQTVVLHSVRPSNSGSLFP